MLIDIQRQTDTHRKNQTTNTYWQIYRYRDSDIHTDRHTYIQTDIHTYRQTDRQTYRETYIHTDIDRDRGEIYRETHADKKHIQARTSEIHIPERQCK